MITIVTPILVLPFPVIDPVAFSWGPFEVRWYALAYLLGFLCNWAYARILVRADHLWGDNAAPNPGKYDRPCPLQHARNSHRRPAGSGHLL